MLGHAREDSVGTPLFCHFEYRVCAIGHSIIKFLRCELKHTVDASTLQKGYSYYRNSIEDLVAPPRGATADGKRRPHSGLGGPFDLFPGGVVEQSCGVHGE
jgi:hypothetical protein